MVDPQRFDTELSAASASSSTSERKARLAELTAMQNDMLAAVNAMSQV